MTHAHTDITQDAVLGDRYRLGEQIAVGGSARVVAAVDERLGRRVAVKLVDARAVEASDPAARQRFLREARTAAGFSHQHAVAVYDAGEDAGVLYLVMELVDGPSLAQVLADGPLPVDQAVRICAQVLAALEAAHASGVVHRDVKPANVLLTSSGEAKLADFGIAKRFDDLTDSVTRTGFVVGTPRYLAPEQALGQPLTPATDVYAAGVLLYEMLTGEAPYEGATPAAAMLAHHAAPVPDLTRRRPDVPPGLAAVVTRALAKDPSDRYASAEAMAAALRRTPTDTQVMPATATPTPATRTRAAAPGVRRVRRPWWPLAGFVALVVLALVAVAIVTDDPVVDPDRTDVAGATSAPAATVPATIQATVPTTVPAAPPPTTTPAVAEIIPGFPVTGDIGQFLEQVRANPALVGDAGGELAEALARVLEDGGRKQADRAEELRQRLAVWTGEARLAPEIASALDALLAPLADKPGRDGDDGDD
jgi:hypothetical protein